MPLIQRLRAVWTGFPGAPGVTTLYAGNAALEQAPLKAFFDALALIFPTDVSIKVDTTGEIIESTTGVITNVWGGSDLPPTVGTSGGVYSAPVGACVDWRTNSFVNGRRLVGRTFLVPMGGALFQTDGTLGDANRAGILAAAQTMLAAQPANLYVWSRPQVATPVWTDVRGRIHAAKPARDGSFSFATIATVPDKAVVLRSRRD